MPSSSTPGISPKEVAGNGWRIQFSECSGNSRPNLDPAPPATSWGAIHGLVSCSEWTGVPLAILLAEAGADRSAQWLLPSRWLGAYRAAPNTISGPTVYANAFTACADSAARASAWTRTRLKSCPSRDSMKARVCVSSGWPGEDSTSCTMGGTVVGSA